MDVHIIAIGFEYENTMSLPGTRADLFRVSRYAREVKARFTLITDISSSGFQQNLTFFSRQVSTQNDLRILDINTINIFQSTPIGQSIEFRNSELSPLRTIDSGTESLTHPKIKNEISSRIRKLDDIELERNDSLIGLLHSKPSNDEHMISLRIPTDLTEESDVNSFSLRNTPTEESVPIPNIPLIPLASNFGDNLQIPQAHRGVIQLKNVVFSHPKSIPEVRAFDQFVGDLSGGKRVLQTSDLLETLEISPDEHVLVYFTGHGVGECILLPNNQHLPLAQIQNRLLHQKPLDVFWVLDGCSISGQTLRLPFFWSDGYFHLEPKPGLHFVNTLCISACVSSSETDIRNFQKSITPNISFPKSDSNDSSDRKLNVTGSSSRGSLLTTALFSVINTITNIHHRTTFDVREGHQLFPTWTDLCAMILESMRINLKDHNVGNSETLLTPPKIYASHPWMRTFPSWITSDRIEQLDENIFLIKRIPE